jgi:hypothetical protein
MPGLLIEIICGMFEIRIGLIRPTEKLSRRRQAVGSDALLGRKPLIRSNES